MFGFAVTLYLFLGGSGAGACMVLSFVGLRCLRMLDASGYHQTEPSHAERELFARRRLLSAGYATALCLLLLGVICLLCDLEHPERVLFLVASPALTYLTVGAYALVICMALAGVLALAWSGRVGGSRRGVSALACGAMCALGVVCAAVALVVAAYTGLLLSSVKAVPLWSSWLVPVLFVASSISCGVALVVLVARLCGVMGVLACPASRMLRVDVVAVVVEAAAAAVLLAALASGTISPLPELAFPSSALAVPALELAAARSAHVLLAGEAAWLFWGGFVGLGLVVPLAVGVSLSARRASLASNALVVMATSALLGGLALRVCIVEAGFPLAIIG